jgi:polyhydroxyalkanoate synthase
LPLFLELIRTVAGTAPDTAARALAGLARYEDADRNWSRRERPLLASAGPATLRDCGGRGPPAVLVPSLINPPTVLDLDEEVSLADAVAGMGRKALLLDWGPAQERLDLDLGRHVERLLLPLLGQLAQPPALIGYCLGGTMAIAAANLIELERVATIAAPWRFAGYDTDARTALARLWAGARPGAERIGALPMEVLQGAFWSLDPQRTVSKFARFGELEPASDRARRFVTLEDWANEGEPLPLAAARELIEDLFGRDLPGRGEWRVGGRMAAASLDCPLLNISASNDRITPAASAPPGPAGTIAAGHVGMVVGSRREQLHAALAEFLAAPCR